MPFAALGLSPALQKAVAERDYLSPTPVQTAAIPAVLHGRDVWATAQTGSGKTAAFALPILQLLVNAPRETPRRIRALILAPTRELAAQIGESFQRYGRHLPDPVKVVTVFGGVSINPQMMALRGGADIVVATPGRLLDLVDHNALRLHAVSTLVLDEADRLFSLGFAAELGRILSLLPADRQNLLFSATYPAEVNALATELLEHPLRVDVASTPDTTPDIVERAIEVDVPRRTQLLRHLIKENSWKRVLVFVATKYATEHIAEKLRRLGVSAGALHGELSQGARTRALADFKASHLQVLVATDLAARGLDIVQLPVVVNFDLPRSTVDYTHRIGRTGRAGEAGLAVSFVSADSHLHFRLIEKRHARTIPREQIAGFEPVETTEPLPPSSGGVKGKRKSKKDKLREAAAQAGHASAPGTTSRADLSPPDRSAR
jgi:ATP-dependent RNA helicase RhlE